MSSHYSKQYYEDVARTLKEQATYYSGIVNDGQAIVAGVVLGRTIESFADLFAADNLPSSRCWTCGSSKESGFTCTRPDGEHRFGGFDREQFLAACGLEPVKETN